MSELDPITVTLANRNTSQINEGIELEMIIETPSYEKQMRILFPPTQVKILEN